MNSKKSTKINLLLKQWPKGTVAVSPWLESKGIYYQLKDLYKQSDWVESLGSGAIIRSGDNVGWEGGLYAIQKQLQRKIHVGAKTALELQGRAHNINFKQEKIFLFSPRGVNFPTWFRKHNSEKRLLLFRTNFLPSDLSLKEYEYGEFSITISSLERAIFECLFLIPNYQEFQEAFYLMEGLMGLRPKLLQKLLEKCDSIKVKRLFLFLAERANMPWLKKLDLSNINLGTGRRQIVKGGRLNSKYQITIPSEFQADE